MSNLDYDLVFIACFTGAAIWITGWWITSMLEAIQRTLAKLPAHMQERKEIVLPPREEARQGDVIFHFPTSLFGDRG